MLQKFAMVKYGVFVAKICKHALRASAVRDIWWSPLARQLLPPCLSLTLLIYISTFNFFDKLFLFSRKSRLGVHLGKSQSFTSCQVNSSSGTSNLQISNLKRRKGKVVATIYSE